MASLITFRDGDWSNPSNNPSSPWYDGATQSALARSPGDNDTVISEHVITTDTIIIGMGLSSNQARTGTVGTGGTPSTTLTGVGTLFLSELSVGDIVHIGSNLRIITAIANDTSLTMSASATISAGQSFTFTPTAIYMRGTSSRLIINSSSLITIKGAFVHNQAIASKTDVVTIAAGAGIEFDVPSGSRYPWVLIGANSQFTRLKFNGVAGNRCYLRSKSGGGVAYLTLGGSVVGGWLNATYTDFTRIGDASTVGYGYYLGNNAAAELSLNECDFNSLGTISSSTAAHTSATYSIVNCKFINSMGTNPLSLSTPGATAGGVVTGCKFDKRPALVGSVANWTISGNVFNDGVTAGGTAPWIAFSGNVMRQTTDSFNMPGDVTGNVLFYDNPARLNPHWIQTAAGLVATKVDIDKNLFLFNGTDPNGNPIVVNTFPTATPVNVRFNLSPPNAGGKGCAFLESGSDSTFANARITFDHNTICIEDQHGLEIGHLQTAVESPNRWVSIHGNLFFGSTSTGFKAKNVDSSALEDIIPPANIGLNGSYKVKATSGTAGFTNEGNGFAAKFSTTPGTTDLDLDASGGPNFVNGSASLAAWDASLGGPGTEANAMTQLLAGTAGYTPQAVLDYLQSAYCPQNSVLNGVTATYDGTTGYTTDAAGNPLTGTIGAMAYINNSQSAIMIICGF